MLVFIPTVKKGQKRKFAFYYRGPYTIAETKNDLIFNIVDKKTWKAINFHYDRLKRQKKIEKNHSRLSFGRNAKQQRAEEYQFEQLRR